MSGQKNAGNKSKACGWHLSLGLLMLAVGMAAIIFPFAASIAIEILLGWLMLTGGIFGIVHAISTIGTLGVGFRLIAAVVSTLVGAWLIFDPTDGLLALTILLGIYFLVNGAMNLGMSFALRSTSAGFITLISGLAALVLGILVLINLRESFAWVPGIIFGIGELLNGWTMIFRAMAERQTEKTG